MADTAGHFHSCDIELRIFVEAGAKNRKRFPHGFEFRAPRASHRYDHFVHRGRE
jgi:hypothetical protein